MYYEEIKFPSLTADDVECRVAMVKPNGVQLLLYKDARVDQRLLDATVGAMNWKREHQLIGDRLYCTVTIKDPFSGEWVGKQDVGTESYTEKEKGQASDAFKRACFNWGIGRELYTAPFIWISAERCDIRQVKDKYVCYTRFNVQRMEVEDGKVIGITIGNDKGETVYSFGTLKKAQPKPKVVAIDEYGLASLKKEMERTGVTEEMVCKRFEISNLEQLTDEQFVKAKNILMKTPNKGGK